MKATRYFSACSGIGGFELGLGDSECVGYSEIDEYAIKTYQHNFPTHKNYGDLTKIVAQELPDFDLFVAGFPCQPFSIAGEMKGFEDVRGTIFYDIVRILEVKKPRNFILENVKGLFGHDGGRTFRTIIETLVELGYCVEWQLLNSKDFGVPQSRERAYIVGHFGKPPEQQVFPIARESNKYPTLSKSTKTAVARTFTAGGNSGGNHSGMTIIRTAEGDRRLTVNEVETLQGFPKNFTIGSNSQRYKQLGNAVTVPVIKEIFRVLDATSTV